MLDMAYTSTKSALLELLAERPAADWQRPVPATPEWCVRDVVAHVTGLAAEAAADTLPGINLLEQFRDEAVIQERDTFAQRQVTTRDDRSPTLLAAEWGAAEAILVTRLAPDRSDEHALPFGMDVVLVTDLCVHADDIAGALGTAPWRDSAASKVAFAGYCFGVDYRVRTLALPALALRSNGKERVLGDGPPAATLTADRWELLRALAGRRSREQIESMQWTGDPGPYLPLIPAYGERSDPLIEG